MNAASPDWCESSFGTSNVLVVAPHGGLSGDPLLSAAAAGRRGNDLHTATLARELAASLSGASIINGAHDRNVLDLNRVRDVVTRAPWFLEELERHLDRILESHETARVLFVHGWHVGQARCDLGIGASLETAEEAHERAEVLSASPEFVTGDLEQFRRRLESGGVIATYGERWPAAHRNNVMRLFRRRPDDSAPAEQLERWVRERRVDAVQLELGAPLRWPGRRRDAFLEGASQAFAGRAASRAARPIRSPLAAGEIPPPAALGLHAFDSRSGADGLGLIVGAMHLPGKDVGARLQLFPGGQRMAIFTGHGRVGPVLGVPDLYFHPSDDGFDVRFDGHVLEVDDAAGYFEQEASQAEARLRDAVVRLSYRERLGGVGHVHGTVELGRERFELATTAFADVRMAPGRGVREGIRIQVCFEDDTPALRVDGEAGGTRWRVARLDAGGWVDEERDGELIRSRADQWSIALEGSESLDIHVRTRAALLRPVGPRTYVHTTFGVVRVVLGDRSGAGFFEQRRPL